MSTGNQGDRIENINLNPVSKATQESNRFCGPAVVSIITGITTDEAEKLFQDVRKSSKSITVVYASELVAVFERLGYKAHFLSGVRGQSLFRLMTTYSKPGIYLFFVQAHVITIEIGTDGKRWLCDNQSKKPLSLSNSARLSQKVMAVTKLEKV